MCVVLIGVNFLAAFSFPDGWGMIKEESMV